jgi:hypothetical protein
LIEVHSRNEMHNKRKFIPLGIFHRSCRGSGAVN